MTDENALIAGIEANPADDLPRLVYADWLEERGHAGGPYLRTELELAKLGRRSKKKAAELRVRLLELRQDIDPEWQARFDQPHLMRANPTPFTPEWIGTDLPGYRNVAGTYGGSKYTGLPSLPVEQFHGDWKWLLPPNHKPRHTKAAEPLMQRAAKLGLTFPPGFAEFASDSKAQSLIRSNTDCYFDWKGRVIPSPSGEGAYLIRFYADSQGCVYWYLYATPSGYSCVVAAPELGDDDIDDDNLRPPSVSFCSPSFEAFIYRMWIENEIWYRLVNPQCDFHDPRPMTSEMQAYLDHYRRSR